MPMTGAGLNSARLAARQGVLDTYEPLTPLSPEQSAQLGLDMLEADSEAIVAYLEANGVVAFAGQAIGVGLTSATGGPVTGTLTVGGGTID